MTDRRTRILVLAAVLFSAALVQGRSLFLGFNSFWDLYHVFRNPFQNPLSFKLIGQAFTVIVEAEYTPVRLLTNSIDYTFWNFNPFGHHLASYLFFLLNVMLVYFVAEKLLALAGRRFPERVAVAGLTAVLFGIHPLRVEVVAWITPREYILCSCFYLLSIIFYLKWAADRSFRWYLPAVLCALGAGLSHPLSVSLPLSLLVLDYYPLGRLRGKHWKRVLSEKIPFVLIALFVTVRIIQIRRQVQIIHPAPLSSLLDNLAEFPAVIVFYIYKTVFPLVLAPIYPMEYAGSAWLMASSGLLVVATIAFLVIRRNRCPGVLTGALLFVIALLPAGGLMRSGVTVLADRYAQLASIPILLGLSWLIIRGLKPERFRRVLLLLAAGWMVFLAWKTVAYTGLWDQPLALTRQAYRRWPDSKIIELFMLRCCSNVAMGSIEEGKTEAALEYVREALRIKPDYVDAYLVWAHALARQGKDEEAQEVYGKALKIKHDYGNTYLNRGILYARRGELNQAETEFQRALFYGEDSAEAHYNLGLIYRNRGELDRAEYELKQALSLNRFSPEVFGQLARLLERRGRFDEVVEVYREGARNNPRTAEYRLALGFACLRSGDIPAAIAAFQAAIDLDDGLGAAYCGLAACSLQRGDKEQARRFRDEALRRGYDRVPPSLSGL